MAQKIQSIPDVVNNKASREFEIVIDGMLSKVPYNIKGDVIGFFHTEVPEPLQGLGIATKLALYALNYAKENKLQVLPYCPFIAKYIKQHPEWEAYVKHYN